MGARARVDETGPRLSTQQVADLLGVTYAVVNRWANNGCVPGLSPNPGTGNFRYFTPDQVDCVAVMVGALRSASTLLYAAGLDGHARSLLRGFRQ